MATAQIQSCTERLATVSNDAAEQFAQTMREAARLNYRAAQLRREAWEMYRATLGLKKVNPRG